MTSTSRTKRILLVDDDVDLLDTLSSLLVESDFEVATATNGSSFFSKHDDVSPDLILLDIRLGAENGFDLMRRLRKNSDVPVIMLTAKSDEIDQVAGLELGADDYITKPYRSAELLARIRSVLRRCSSGGDQGSENQKSVAHFGNWHCDLVCRKLISVTGDEVPLTSGEFLLLTAFVKNPDRILSRERLLELTHRENTVDRSLDVQVMRLRRKLEQDVSAPELIQAVRSVGYVFASQVEWTRDCDCPRPGGGPLLEG